MIVAITSPGQMGSAVGRLLAVHSATVRTSLRGRSAKSAERARAAGLQIAETDDDLVAGADFVLSILPPADAIAVAQRLRAPLERAAAKPIYVECNAVAPSTTRRVAEIVEPTGCTFIDGGIVGSPPTEDAATSPTFAVSGPRAQQFEPLTKFGLKMRLLGDSIGQASALKLAYGGIQKGVGAVGLAMILGAAHHGVADELREELAAKQSFLAKWLDKQIDQTFSKAYRFAGEMEEIAGFHENDEGAAKIYEGMALLYERVGKLFAESGTDGAELDAVVRFIRGLPARGSRDPVE